MAEKITPEEAANVAAAEAAAAVAAAQAEADAARDEREEYLFDLANQIASSQVATQVVAPVALLYVPRGHGTGSAVPASHWWPRGQISVEITSPPGQ